MRTIDITDTALTPKADTFSVGGFCAHARYTIKPPKIAERYLLYDVGSCRKRQKPKREGSELMSLDTSNETHGYLTGTVIVFAHNVPVYNSSESSFELDISWEGTTNGYSGGATRSSSSLYEGPLGPSSNSSETEWRINEDRTWNKLGTNGNWVTGQPEEADCLRYGGGITATLAKEKTPGGLTSGAPAVKGATTVAKPTFRPGFPAGGQSGSVPVPTEVPQPPDIQTPEPSGSPVTEVPKNQTLVDNVFGWIHFGLDIVGCAPVIGEVADGVNAGLYAIRGDYANAAISAAAMIPLFGIGATATKLGKRAFCTVAEGVATQALKHGDDIVTAGSKVTVNTVVTIGCFTAGTQVVVGVEYDENDVFVRYVTTNIEDIKVGDLVYSYDTINGIYEYKEVTETIALKSDHINYLTIEDENGNIQTIETTDVHPFWVVTDNPDLERAARSVVDENGTVLYHENLGGVGGFWVEAKDLRIGDVFLGATGGLTAFVSSERWDAPGGVSVYNFKVDGNSNYFVIAQTGDHGSISMLVHNGTRCFPDHHSIPQFLGGNRNQPLTNLPLKVHQELHSEINTALKARGLPPANRNSGAWKELMGKTPRLQHKAFRAVFEASKKIDAQYGTTIARDFIRNVFTREFSRFL